MHSKVDLGCGSYKKAGYYGIDIDEHPGVDLVYNLNEGIPLPTGSVDELFSQHSLEHFQNPLFILDEIYRVCSDHARIEITVPLYQVWQPDHITCFYDDWFERNALMFNVLEKRITKTHDAQERTIDQLTVVLGKK